MSHPLYPKEQELRNRVLLRPIGMPDHAWEMYDDLAHHLVYLDEEYIPIACLLLKPLDDEGHRVQLMQMAVDSEKQGLGIGRALVLFALSFCRKKGVSEMMCHARQNVVSFYEKLGFVCYGDPFEEVGIQHRYMRRKV